MREVEIRNELGYFIIADLTAPTKFTIENNAKIQNFAKIPYLSTVRVSRRMMAFFDAEQREVRYPRVADMFPSSIRSGSEVHSRYLHYYEPCAYGL